jgi:hypothetical protein
VTQWSSAILFTSYQLRNEILKILAFSAQFSRIPQLWPREGEAIAVATPTIYSGLDHSYNVCHEITRLVDVSEIEAPLCSP